MQAMAALQQQQQMQQQLLTQQLIQQAVAALPSASLVTAPAAPTALNPEATRKAREIYVGNLAIGNITADLLRELFNACLANFTPNPVTDPPVIQVKLDSSGRFAFVELRTLELADKAMALDKMEVCSRQINVGRPKGWAEEHAKVQNMLKLNMAQSFAAQLSGGTSNVILLENLVTAQVIRSSDQERRELHDDVYTEAVKCGTVLGVAIPVPPADVADEEPCRIYVKYHNEGEATKCKQMMDGRMFDDNKVKANYSTEFDFSRAQQGEWIQAAPAIQQVAAPPLVQPVMVPQVSVPSVPLAMPQFGAVPGALPPGVIPQITIPNLANIPGLGFT